VKTAPDAGHHVTGIPTLAAAILGGAWSQTTALVLCLYVLFGHETFYSNELTFGHKNATEKSAVARTRWTKPLEGSERTTRG